MMFTKYRLLCLFLYLPLAGFPAACMGKTRPPGLAAPGARPEEAALETAAKNYRDLTPEERAERMMKAFLDGYPDAVEKAEFRRPANGGAGDWAVLMKGRWFYCADGRLLPEELLDKKDEYARQSFYDYFPELPEWKAPEGEAAERLKRVLDNRRANPPKRAPDFYDTLWDAHNRDESYGNVVKITFLGRGVLVHKKLVERLAAINRRIEEAAKADPEVRQFIGNIGSLGAWNWRNVAATASRSYHSYAVALDILPASMRGLQTYWQWTADNGIEWYNVPYSGRFHPPDAVVKAFEAYGFCWGGKWMLFDTMHFEYRPEIMLMHGLEVEDLDASLRPAGMEKNDYVRR